MALFNLTYINIFIIIHIEVINVDYVIRGKQITLWEGQKYIGSISRNETKKKLVLQVSGIIEAYSFDSIERLKNYINNRCMVKINISDELIEYLECILVLWKLTD